MPFNGTEGSEIDITTAADYTANYRLEYPGSVQAIFMGKDILNAILTQEGCMGIRVYFGKAAAGSSDFELVFVGADANENDIINNGGIVADSGTKCPHVCGSINSLNS
ncbi:MAG: hypothetical protein KBB37_10495 [Bacteroidia bacterium]|nr:hypothetical protein [Bacteroidia bacterium]MBP9180126.1 hypothetical protein [Bacteroidia bacterium]